MKYKYFFAVTLATLLMFGQIAAQSAIVKPGDVKLLEGGLWIGTLSYIDYSTNKRTVINSALVVSDSKADKSAWIFDFRYPQEPSANQTRDVKLSPDGTMFDGAAVIERAELPNKVLKVVTTKRGRDNDRDVELRFTYLIGRTLFSIRKEVKANETDGFFERNTYSWRQ